MSKEKVGELFNSVNIWKRGSQRAPHKPLLILLAISKCINDGVHKIPFSEVDEPLTQLLQNYGPPRTSYHSEYPFWRLRNDGIWVLENAELCEVRKRNTDAKKTELLKHDVRGGFTPEIFAFLRNNKQFAYELGLRLLQDHFPESMHQDILDSVGLQSDSVLQGRKRDSKFREIVLSLYEYRCAICNYDICLSGRPIGLEAAHIEWHQAGGPDEPTNGLALCTLHHKLFDRGVLGLSPECELLVSQFSHGSDAFERWVLCFNGRKIRSPQSRDFYPSSKHIEWHTKEVFRGPHRKIS